MNLTQLCLVLLTAAGGGKPADMDMARVLGGQHWFGSRLKDAPKFESAIFALNRLDNFALRRVIVRYLAVPRRAIGREGGGHSSLREFDVGILNALRFRAEVFAQSLSSSGSTQFGPVQPEFCWVWDVTGARPHLSAMTPGGTATDWFDGLGQFDACVRARKRARRERRSRYHVNPTEVFVK